MTQVLFWTAVPRLSDKTNLCTTYKSPAACPDIADRLSSIGGVPSMEDHLESGCAPGGAGRQMDSFARIAWVRQPVTAPTDVRQSTHREPAHARPPESIQLLFADSPLLIVPPIYVAQGGWS